MKNLKRFWGNWQNLLALFIVTFYVGVAIAAPKLAPPNDSENPSQFQTPPGVRVTASRPPQPPRQDAPLGTVPGGWDVFYSMVWGTRPVLRFGLIVTSMTAFLGTLIGAVSGYLGGFINRLVMRITDAFLTFPSIAAVFLFGQMMLPTNPGAVLTTFQKVMLALNLDPVMLALILCSWMPYARLINANIIRLKQTEYAMAAKTVGVPPLRIILRHLLPNALAPVIVLAARDVGGLVILEAAFTFIGVGGNSTWGQLLVAGRGWIIGPGGNPLAYWWIFLPPTLALVLFGIAWNLLGDGLNSLLDPRSAHQARRFALIVKSGKPRIPASDESQAESYAFKRKRW